MAEQLADVFDVQIQFPLDLRTVKPDLNARNAIGTFQRYDGLEVWVVNEGTKYRLEGGITNDDWVVVDDSDGAGLQSVTVSDSNPTGGNPGDIHFKNIEGGTEVWYNNAGTWGSVGSIPTGGDTPNLQEVTDVGSTTTNTITAEGFNANNYAVVSGIIRVRTDEARITFEDDIQNYSHLNLRSNIVSRGGHISVLSAGTSGAPTYGSLSTDILTSSRIFTLPDKPGTIALLDDILTGPTYTQDQDVPNTGALSYLNSEYPDAKPGDQVYKVASGMRRTWTCYAAGEWSRIDEVIET